MLGKSLDLPRTGRALLVCAVTGDSRPGDGPSTGAARVARRPLTGGFLGTRGARCEGGGEDCEATEGLSTADSRRLPILSLILGPRGVGAGSCGGDCAWCTLRRNLIPLPPPSVFPTFAFASPRSLWNWAWQWAEKASAFLLAQMWNCVLTSNLRTSSTILLCSSLYSSAFVRIKWTANSNSAHVGYSPRAILFLMRLSEIGCLITRKYSP